MSSAEICSGVTENEDYGKKRYCGKSVEIYKRTKRDRYECTRLPVSLSQIHVTDDPKIAIFADKFLEIKEKEIDVHTAIMKNAAFTNRLEEIEKCTVELCQIITMYPELSGYLITDLLELLVELLKNEKNPKLQSQAATILQYVFTHSRNGSMVIEKITSKIVVNLICSDHSDVQVQVLKLVHDIAGTNPCPKLNAILEEAIKPITHLLTIGSTNNEVLYSGAKALEVACQVHPKLPRDKLEDVLNALTKLMENHNFDIRSSACLGIGYLCDGRKEMIVEDKYIKVVVDRLLEFISLSHIRHSDVNCVAGHTTLGSMVRWDNGEFIKFMIKEKALYIIEEELVEEDLYYVKSACWILSNITAGIEEHLQDVMYSKMISLLFQIIGSSQFIDVKVEAIWALLNAIHGVGSDQIEEFKKQCIKPFWNTLKACHQDEQIVYLCLEGLIRLEGIEVTCNDEPFGGAEFKELLVHLYGGVLDEGSEWLVKLKKLRLSDSEFDINKGLDNLVFRLTCTFEENVQQPFFLLYNSSCEDSPCLWSGKF